MSSSSERAARQIEAERSQIGHEIHDSLLPMLFAASSALSTLPSDSEGLADEGARRRVDQARAWIDEAMQIGRRLLTEIYPPELESNTWFAAARDAIDRLLVEKADRVRWDLDDELAELPGASSFAAYRIVVEAIRNAIGHGDAAEVVVTVRESDGKLMLQIRDDGTGFDPGEQHEGRFGLKAMKGRAELAGGNLSIQSRVGGPTVVQCELPRHSEST